MELAHQLADRKAVLRAQWLPRLQNEEADALTNCDFRHFDAAKRIRGRARRKAGDALRDKDPWYKCWSRDARGLKKSKRLCLRASCFRCCAMHSDSACSFASRRSIASGTCARRRTGGLRCTSCGERGAPERRCDGRSSTADLLRIGAPLWSRQHDPRFLHVASGRYAPEHGIARATDCGFARTASAGYGHRRVAFTKARPQRGGA